jgi:phosphoglucomutase
MRNKIKTPIGRQYATRSNANRAIRNFRVKHFVSIPKGFQFWVNKIDEGCFEIDGAKT